jgi:hypothetical protein
MDATTDIIAHFIGCFDVPAEAPRLQILYDPFELEREPTELEPRAPLPPREFDAPYQLRGHDGSAELSARSVPPVESGAAPATASAARLPGPAADPTPLGLPASAFTATGGLGAGGAVPGVETTAAGAPTSAPPTFTLPVPNSIATVTVQTNRLADDDLLLAGDGAPFLPVAPLAAGLAQARLLGDHLLAAVLGDLSTAAPSHPFAVALADRIEKATPPTVEGLEATVLKGTEASGVVVDGVPAAAMPVWRDLLPEALRPQDGGTGAAVTGGDEPRTPSASGGDGAATAGTAEAGTAVSAAPVAERVAPSADHDGAGDADTRAGDADREKEARDPFEATPGGDDDGPAGDVDAGYDVVTGANQAINQAAIAYDWLDAPVIVVGGDVVDLDFVVQHHILHDRDAPAPSGPAEQPAAAAAAVSPPPPAPTPAPADQTPTAPAAAGDGDAPAASARPSQAINAVSLTKTSAPAPAPDPAAASSTLPASAVARLGEVSLTNTVQQHNFVTDHDRAEISLAAGNADISTGENVTVNEAFLTELGYRFDLIVVDGDLIEIDLINQLNVLLDDDLDPSLAAGTWTSADNLLLNTARLEGHGVDTYTGLSDAFAAAADEVRQGAETLAREILEDARFAGDDLVAALHIAGDLVVTNVIDQRTYLGDQDQVHLARDALAAATAAPLEVTTGANALLNAATITEYGIDSEIMAAGRVYEDAMLYQAGLVDTDDRPMDLDMPALVNEAVAFLADGLTLPAQPEVPAPPSGTEAGPLPADIMQTMLA